MAQDERPFINLSAMEIIEQGEQLLASADMIQLRILLKEISKRKKAEKKLASIKIQIEKNF